MRWWLAIIAVASGCGDGPRPERPCDLTGPQPSRATIDCWQEFTDQADRPLDSALPGALTIKTMIDQPDGDTLYFLDTATYPVHEQFARDRLGWPFGLPFTTEYFYPQRRFLLGSVTYYQEPERFVYELAPYDTASPEMIDRSMRLVTDASYFGVELAFHPTSEEQEARVAQLPDLPVVTTEELYAGISYQPLNLAETIGQVRLLTVEQLATEYVSPYEIVVLDRVPNDISVVAGVVTAQFQTPLSHVNVLSQQRGTPNMALRHAAAVFAPLDGQWVHLTVGAFGYSAEPASPEQADQWWQEHRPTPIEIAAADDSVTDLRSLDQITLADLPAFGGKAAHYAELRHIEGIAVRPGFAVPVHYYRAFLRDHGFDRRIAWMLDDPEFQADGNVRRQRLTELRAEMRAARVDPELLSLIEAAIGEQFPGARMRFRSSTTAEDLDGFSGAGLYSSASGEVGSAEDSIADAVREVWASLWSFRAFEERAYVGIDQERVAMALLCHPAYTDETANGVAITANVFDPAPGGEDGFYINVQLGQVSVVQPPENGVVPDQLTYYFDYPNQPATYYTSSSLLGPGQTVLDRHQLYLLGQALSAIRDHFSDTYQPPEGYGRLPMDVEFKRIGEGEAATIWIKQARPYPGRGH